MSDNSEAFESDTGNFAAKVESSTKKSGLSETSLSHLVELKASGFYRL